MPQITRNHPSIHSATMAESQLHKGLQEYELKGIINTKEELQRDSNATVLELKFHGLRCAGKKIKPEFYDEASLRERSSIERRLEHECKILSMLRHPNIVQFMGVMYDDHPLPIIVTEFLPVTLNTHLKKYGVLPDPISYSILDDVAKGLCYLHAHQPNPIIHENLTANNVLLTDSKGAKISCLGETKVQGLKLPLSSTSEPPACRESDKPTNTVSRDVMIDIFSFGILIIHTFSGNCPMLPSPVHQAFMLQQMDKQHPLMNLSEKCLTTDIAVCLRATDILDSIREVRVKNKIDSVSVVQESAYAAEWQHLLSTIHKLQSDHHAMIEEQRHTAGAMKSHTTFLTKIESLELSELKIKNSHMKEYITRIGDELEAKRRTIQAKNEAIKELIDYKEREEDAILSLQNKKKELVLKDELLRINEKRVEQLTILLNTTRSKVPHPLNMKYKLTWREVAKAPFGVTAPQHVVIGSALYLGGGQTNSSDSNRIVLHYCMDSNQWDSLPPSPFMHFGLGQLAGKLVTVGGSLEDNNATVTGEVMHFSKTWVKLIDPMPTPRRRACVVSYQSCIAACGGIERDGTFSNVVEVFYQEQWCSACPLPAPRAALGATIKDGRVYFTGGFYPSLKSWNDAQQDCNSVELSMLFTACRAMKWTSLPPVPAKCTTAISHCGTLLVMGGLHPHSFSNSHTVHAYSAGTKSWVPVDELPFGRSSMMVTSTYNGDLLLVGGWDESYVNERSTCVKIGTYTPIHSDFLLL